MFYHASRTPGITVLEPRISNHGKPLIYFSTKRENVLVYLCNAVEKHCKQIGFLHSGAYYKWGSYGFTEDGILCLEEYYPGATYETYKGEPGYIYSAQVIENYANQPDIPCAVTSSNRVMVTNCEYIPDAYEEIQRASASGKIVLRGYADNNQAMLDWIEKTIRSEYDNAAQQPEYREFLKAKFVFL